MREPESYEEYKYQQQQIEDENAQREWEESQAAAAQAEIEQGDAEIEEMAKQLHLWYLEVTKKLSPDSFNHKAQKEYEELTEEQKIIDRYIAEKIISKIEEEVNQLKDEKQKNN